MNKKISPYFLLLVLTFVFSFSSHATAADAEKTKLLNDLWNIYETSSGMAHHAVEKYAEVVTNDPNTKYVQDSRVKSYAVEAIRQRWVQYMDKNFSNKELDYIVRLYSSSLFKKLNASEESIWNTKALSATTAQALKQAVAQYKLTSPPNAAPNSTPNATANSERIPASTPAPVKKAAPSH